MKDNALALLLLATLILTAFTLHIVDKIDARTILTEPIDIHMDPQTKITYGPVLYPCEAAEGGGIPVEACGPDGEAAAEAFRQAWQHAAEVCKTITQSRGQ